MKESGGIKTWLCLSLSRSLQSHNKAYNRCGRFTSVRVPLPATAGFLTSHQGCISIVDVDSRSQERDKLWLHYLNTFCIYRAYTSMWIPSSCGPCHFALDLRTKPFQFWFAKASASPSTDPTALKYSLDTGRLPPIHHSNAVPKN